jgi:hypothetical protein
MARRGNGEIAESIILPVAIALWEASPMPMKATNGQPLSLLCEIGD